MITTYTATAAQNLVDAVRWGHDADAVRFHTENLIRELGDGMPRTDLSDGQLAIYALALLIKNFSAVEKT
jgi:hypothetical protein